MCVFLPLRTCAISGSRLGSTVGAAASLGHRRVRRAMAQVARHLAVVDDQNTAKTMAVTGEKPGDVIMGMGGVTVQ